MKHNSHPLIILTAALMLGSCASNELSISLENPLNIQRNSALVEIQRSDIEAYLDCSSPIMVMGPKDHSALPVQFLDLNQDDEWETLLLQVSMEAQERFNILLSNSNELLESDASKVNGRFVPERKDDFAWENDRIAFRMYGPALEATGEISSGIDVWVKRVEYPIIDKWYASGKYHSDNGEGADLYKVGPTLGCGGLGLLFEDTLYTSKNFTEYRILAEGPFHFVFELDYETWGPDSLRISETKRISLDAGQHFNHISSELTFSTTLPETMEMVTGLVAHPILSENPVSIYSSDDYMILYEGFKDPNGFLGTAIIRQPLPAKQALKKYGDQFLMVVPMTPDGTISYYAGAAWSKSPWINSEEDWQNHVKTFEQQLNHPIQVTFKH